MMSFILENKRSLSIVVLAAFFFISGILGLSADMVNTGGLFFVTAIIVLIYLPVFWLLEQRIIKYSMDSWIRKELWFFAVWLMLLNLVGIIESLVYERWIFLLFVPILIAVFLIHRDFKRKTKNMASLEGWNVFKDIFWHYGATLFFLLFGLFVHVFYLEMDGNNELVLLHSSQDYIDFLISFFFIAFFFFAAAWLIRQLKQLFNLKNEKKKMEMAHLQNQVNPHFFFNMLNNLYGLVEEDSKKAQELILKLSDMMRYSIYEGQRDSIPITEEVDYLKNYIALHKTRYHKEIAIEFQTEIEEEAHEVKPLLFILLLENAFKHGVENLRKGAFVHVHLKCTKTEVHFTVKNNYNKTQIPATPGIGLKNLKRRLALVYPKHHQLTFEVTDQEYTAELILNAL